MNIRDSEVSPTSPLVENLRLLLYALHDKMLSSVSDLPSCKKRASVALIIRIRPVFPDHTLRDSFQQGLKDKYDDRKFTENLDSFFRLGWVQRGDPEILFIRRTTRKGDRWSGHVAFPGGKRESSDADDRSTSIRETEEEIGLDLAAVHSLYIGNLAQRVVTTAWGKAPLMVLCPFVYLLTRYDIPPLRLQPSEVAAAHWVPLRVMLSSTLRTYESCRISDRLSRPGGWVVRSLLQIMLGTMLYPAIRLIPGESLYCSSTPGFVPDENPPSSIFAYYSNVIVDSILSTDATHISTRRPLLLWGLSHSIMTDLLEFLPLYNSMQLWAWPTFSHWDVQFILWLITYRFRYQKLHQFRVDQQSPTSIIEEGFATKVEKIELRPEGVSSSLRHQPSTGTTAQILDGYYDRVRLAVIIISILRLGFGSVLLIGLLRRLREKAPTPPLR